MCPVGYVVIKQTQSKFTGVLGIMLSRCHDKTTYE